VDQAMNGFNKVLLAGQVSEAGSKLSYSASGTPLCTFTLVVEESGKEGQAFKLFIPVEVYGAHAEWSAEHLDRGALILVDGKLKWKSALDKQGMKQGRLTVLGWQVSLVGTPHPAMTTN
jgi:single-strand DNA-binding protein